MDDPIPRDVARALARLRGLLVGLHQVAEKGMKPDPHQWRAFHSYIATIASDCLAQVSDIECALALAEELKNG